MFFIQNCTDGYSREDTILIIEKSRSYFAMKGCLFFFSDKWLFIFHTVCFDLTSIDLFQKRVTMDGTGDLSKRSKQFSAIIRKKINNWWMNKSKKYQPAQNSEQVGADAEDGNNGEIATDEKVEPVKETDENQNKNDQQEDETSNPANQ